jgi:hypothetical protein
MSGSKIVSVVRYVWPMRIDVGPPVEGAKRSITIDGVPKPGDVRLRWADSINARFPAVYLNDERQ